MGKIAAAALLLCLVLAGPANAEVIGIRSDLTISANTRGYTATVVLGNTGNTEARNIRALLSVEEDRLATPPIGILQPGMKQPVVHYGRFQEPLAAGTYPAVLLVEYEDEAGYKFSALNCAAFATASGISTDLVAEAGQVELDVQGNLQVRLENPGDRARDIRVRLILPRELAGPDRDRQMALGAGEQRFLTFEIENRAALPGAVYPVFVVCEYDEDYTHYTKLAQGDVHVIHSRSWFGKTRDIWLVALVLFVILMIASGVRSLARRRKKD